MSAAIQNARQVYQALRPLVDEALFRAMAAGASAAAVVAASPFVPLQQFGAKGDVQTVSDASVGAGGTDVHSPSGLFKPSDVGKIALFPGAGAGGAVLQATVTGFTSSTDVTVAPAATTAVSSGGDFAWGTDAGPALVAARAFLTSPALDVVPDLCIFGSFIFGNGVPAWSGGTVLGNGQSTWYADLPGTGDDDALSCIFFAPTQETTTQALSADAPAGARTLTVAALPAGLTLTSTNVPIVLSANAAFNSNGSSYVVKSVSGGGPFVLHLDRALLLSYTVAGGATITVLAQQENDFTIALGGATVTGPAGRYFECFISQRWRITGGNFTDTWGYPVNRVLDLEAFCFDCTVADCSFSGAQGTGISSGEHCYYIRCVFDRIGAASALPLTDVADCWIVDCQVSGSTSATGAVLFTNDVGGGQPFNSGVVRGSYAGNFEGIHVDFGRALAFVDVACVGNTSVGAHLGSTASGGPFYFDGCNLQNNGQPGLQADAGSAYWTCEGCDFSGNATNVTYGAYAVVALSSGTLRDCSALPPASGLNVAVTANDAGGAVTLTVDGCRFTGGIACTGTAVVMDISATTVTLPAGGFFGIEGACGGASVVTLRDLVVSAAGGGSVGIFGSATTTVRMYGRGPVVTGATTPTQFLGFQNRGATVQLNGVTPVAVSWPDLKAGELPKLEITTPPTIGGLAAAGAVLVALTPGTGFTVTGVAGDNGVRQYEI